MINSKNYTDRFKPINGNVLISMKKREEQKEGMLIVNPVENQQIANIIRVADDVENHILKNLKSTTNILVRKMKTAQRRQYMLHRDGIFCIPEGRIIGAFLKDRLKPIGRRLLVKRLIDSEKLESGIIVPYGIQSKDQTMWCEVKEFGITNLGDEFQNPLLATGDRVLLDEWKETMVEIGKQGMDGGYYLSVLEDDICYAEYNTNPSEVLA